MLMCRGGRIAIRPYNAGGTFVGADGKRVYLGAANPPVMLGLSVLGGGRYGGIDI